MNNEFSNGSQAKGENAMQPYSIDTDHRTALEEKILAELKSDEVVKPLQSKLEEFCQRAIDTTTDYLKDQYSLVLEEIVMDRATRMVKALLEGDHDMARFFALEKSILSWGVDAGKDFVCDPDGVRAAIVQNFQEEILTTEMIALREQNKRLAEKVELYRDMR